tara:strand:- start:129 stop:305 length:177 start_codon:yes stop_codon:yes gene_type:complete
MEGWGLWSLPLPRSEDSWQEKYKFLTDKTLDFMELPQRRVTVKKYLVPTTTDRGKFVP